MDDDMMDSLNSVQYQPLQQYEPPQGGERKLDRESPPHQSARSSPLSCGSGRGRAAAAFQELYKAAETYRTTA